MKNQQIAKYAGLMAAATMLGLVSFGVAAADPLPFDLPAPPPTVNAALFYNIYSSSTSFYTSNGTKIGNTRIATDVPIMRVVKGFSVDGMTAAVQVIEPYVDFSGTQEIGGQPLSHNSGFAEPQIGAYIYPVNDISSDQYLVLSYLTSPPTGAFNQSQTLNAGTNSWVNQITVGYGHVLFGQAHTGRRLDFEIWGVSNFYGNNNNFGTLVTPFGSAREQLQTQPSEKLLVYLPYIFNPHTDAYVGLSFAQTFGGKQSVTFNRFLNQSVDTGNRTDTTTVGIFGGTFVSPTAFVYTGLTTDVRTRGGRAMTLRLPSCLARCFDRGVGRRWREGGVLKRTLPALRAGPTFGSV